MRNCWVESTVCDKGPWRTEVINLYPWLPNGQLQVLMNENDLNGYFNETGLASEGREMGKRIFIIYRHFAVAIHRKDS